MTPSGRNVESREYYDELAKQYNYSESYTRRPWTEYFHIDRRIGSIASAVEAIRAGGEIGDAVDVGCGDGALLPMLSKSCRRVTAMDLSPERLKMAEAAAGGAENIEYVVGNIIESTAGREGRYDLVVCSEVIEHVRQFDFFFERLASLVAQNGTLVLTTPSRFAIREKTLRLQQIPLNIYFNRIRRKGLGKFEFFHVGLMKVSELERLAGRHFPQWELKTAGLYFPVVTEIGFMIGKERWRNLYRDIDEKVGKSWFRWINWTQVLVARKSP